MLCFFPSEMINNRRKYCFPKIIEIVCVSKVVTGKELGVSKLVTGKELWSQNRVPDKNCGLKSGNQKRIGVSKVVTQFCIPVTIF